MTAPNPRIPDPHGDAPEVGQVGGCRARHHEDKAGCGADDRRDGDLGGGRHVRSGREEQRPGDERSRCNQVEVRGKSKTVAEVAVIEPVEAEVERDLDPGEREHAERDSQRDCLLEFVDHRLSFSVVVTRGERSRPGGVCWVRHWLGQ